MVIKEVMTSSIWASDSDDENREDLEFEVQVEIAKALSEVSKEEKLAVDCEQSVGNLTRSGRVFKPSDLRTGESSNRKSVEVEKETEAEKEEGTRKNDEKKKEACPGGTDAE